MDYALVSIRQFIEEHFSEDDIDTLSFDHFPEVYQNLSRNATIRQKVLQLLDYCRTRDRLEDLVCLIRDARPIPFSKKFSPSQVSINAIINEEQFDEELLDAFASIEEKFEILTSALNRMQIAITVVGAKASSGTNELNGLQASEQPVSARKTKQVINSVAVNIENFASQIDTELSIFSATYKGTIHSVKLVSRKANGHFSQSEIQTMVESFAGLEINFAPAISGLTVLNDSIIGIPRITSAMQRAKRHAANSLENVIAVFNDMWIETKEAVLLLRELKS